MAGYPKHAGALDPRWEIVGSRDGRNRPCFARSPLVGARFGNLVIQVPARGNDAKSLCRCDCGQENFVENRSLYRGRSTACRKCGFEAGSKKRSAGRGYADIIPDKDTRLMWLHRYTGIISRCYDQNHRAYPNYGGRGIGICDEWRNDRKSFLRYAVTLPGWDDPGLDLDRVDNGGGYRPGNLRLVPRKINSRNKRNNVLVEYAGEKLSIAEFYERFTPLWAGYTTVIWHLDNGRSPGWIVDYYGKTRGRVRSAELRAS